MAAGEMEIDGVGTGLLKQQFFTSGTKRIAGLKFGLL